MRPQRNSGSPIHRNRYPLVAVLGGIAAIFSFSAQAGLVLPDVPLQTGSSLPANIWFILDDSGSMASTHMPDNVPATTPVNIALQTSARNGIYYNPAVTYRPWRRADGTFFPTTLPTAAYTSTTLDSGSINLMLTDQLFYVPKVGISDFSNATQYIRYRLRTTGALERCSTLSYVGSAWTWQSCVNLASETWSASAGTITRSATQEWQNFATWYSYSRTRNKVAKSGASFAFSGLGEDIRVGFTTIWNRGTFDIPVATDNGLFRDRGTSTNRTTWFNRLLAAGASDFTPLRSALRRSGDYFRRTDAAGPYGPESGDQQLACRQNFTILTTDGYWNSDAAFSQADTDSIAGPTMVGPNNSQFAYVPANPYKDGRGNT